MTTAKRDFPRSWRWDDDGNQLAGILVGLRWVKSKQNDELVPVMTFNRDGEDVSVWLSGSLRRKMENESPRYGDTITIERGELVEFGEEGRTYRQWEIQLGRVDGSLVDLTGAGLPQPHEQPAETTAPAVDDSDIPF